MADSKELHVVLGAGGGLGNALVRELVARRKPVRAVTRTGRAELPPGVDLAKGDAADPASAREVCRQATVVYHCANVPYPAWPAQCMPLLAGAIAGAVSAGAKLVFADNLYMYGPVARPLTEDLPYRAAGRKGRICAEVAARLMDAHARGEVRATIGRGSDFYGPGVTNAAMGERLFVPLLTGGAVYLLGDLDAPHTYTFIRDMARGLITLGERPEALGQVWHIPSAQTLTTRHFLRLIVEESGRQPKLRVAPRIAVSLLALFNPLMREIKEILYQFEEPFIMDHSKFQRAFGAKTTPHREAIRETLEWFRAKVGS